MGELEDLCGRTVGDFVLRERIDEGGFGAVYRCEQPLLGREAVVKVLHPKLRRNDVVLQRFMREAQLASRLDHPYAAHVYAFGIEHGDGLFWIAMEMVQGTALNRWLRDRGPLTLHQLVPFFDRVAEVVQAAHERGIVHRDLKPSNVMVIERAGRLLPKLLDFGIAKMLDEAALPLPPAAAARHPAPEAAEAWNPSEMATLTGGTEPPGPHANGHRLTHADATIGSPPYMSPEQWNNAGAVGPASDLYALGVVAYEALTGRRPFSASSIAEYVDMHCNYPVPPLGDGFPPALDRLFARALAKRPEDRWGTALELATALRAASGLGASPSDLPRLDDTVRDRWIAEAPQPLAESIAELDGARNAHQARDAAQELVRNLLRYLLAIGLATRAQVRDNHDDPALLELVRTLRRRDLDEDERVRLLRLLVRPLISRRGAHPVPELVDLVTPRPEDGTDGLDPLLALHPTHDHPGSEDVVRERLTRLLPELAALLRKLTFVLDYTVIVPRNAVAERWTGLRRQRRAQAGVTSGELVKHHPMLLDREGRVCVDLWPLAQCVSPTEGADSELFLFDGRGRNGARMIAAPAGFEHHDPSVWEWIAARVIAEIDGNPEPGSDGPPYLGLTPFSTGDAGRYVGRESEVDAFVNRLRQRSLQVVVGPSGAGKTSFVNAGVIPALPLGWRAVTLRPGAMPLTALAQRITAANLGPADLRTLLEFSPAVATAAITAAAGRSTVVIVVDHLEELFTQCPRPDERTKFATALAELASSEGPIRVIGAIRDDFLMELDSLTPLRALLSPGIVLLGNPSRDALVRIVVEPARRAGYAMSDPELAHDMVSVVADHPGALALLSFTSARLWELRDRRFRQLTRNAYDAMGGIGGALGRHAEDTFDQLSPEEQRLAREIFRHLVTADGTRALVTGKELRQRLAQPRAEAVIDKLVTARLVAISDSSGEPHVEVIHDVLIDAWPRLQQWIREDVDDARMRDQLRIAARQWQDRSRSHALLWRGDVLADLERWLRRPAARALSDLEVAFIAASRRDARRAIRGRRGLGIIAAAFLTLFAMLQYGSMQRDIERRARITQMYIEWGRQALLDGKHMEALLYLAQAVHKGDDSPGVRFMLERAAQAIEGESLRLTSKSGRMWSAIFSKDGGRIVTTDDQGAQVWDAKSGLQLFALPHADKVFKAAYTADGSKLLSASSDGTLKVWNASNGAPIRSLAPPGDKPADYRTIALSPDGTHVASIDATQAKTYVWNMHTGSLVAQLMSESEGAAELAFSDNGKWLAATGGGRVLIYDARTWKQVSSIPTEGVRSFAFVPRTDQVVTGAVSGDISIWDAASGARVRHVLALGDSIDIVVVSPDGRFIAASTSEGAEFVWITESGKLQTRLSNHHRRILALEFDPSSALLMSASSDRRIAISDVNAGMLVSIFEGPANSVVSAHFDTTASQVISASLDGTARLWKRQPSLRQWTSDEVGSDCATDVTPNEDQQYVVVNCPRENRLMFWDTSRDLALATLPAAKTINGKPSPVITRGGDMAAVVNGRTVGIYALPGGALVRTLSYASAVTALRFSDHDDNLVSGTSDGEVRVTSRGGQEVAMHTYGAAIDAVALLADGAVAAADADKHLLVLKPAARHIVAALPLSGRVSAIRPSAKGRVVTIPLPGGRSTPVLWDLLHLREVTRLEGHTGQVYSANFVKNGSQILTAGTDGAARLWDGVTGQLRQTYFGTTTFLFNAALSPDGAMIVTVGGDGFLRFWDTTTATTLWTVRAHKSMINGVHFQGDDIVTRGTTGELSRWHIPKAASSAALIERVDRLIQCMSLQFDEPTGSLVTRQVTCGHPQGEAP